MDRRASVLLLALLPLIGCESSDAGPSGDADAASEGGPGPGGDCTDFSHSETLWGPPRDLLVVGTGFEAHEGDTVRLVITNGEPSYGLAETTIENGAFEFSLPGAVGNYTGMGVYIDRGRDDACTLGVDLSWQRTTGGDTAPVTWTITPDSRPAASDSPCNINGIFDIMMTLPCPG